jgi:hypothetical protein
MDGSAVKPFPTPPIGSLVTGPQFPSAPGLGPDVWVQHPDGILEIYQIEPAHDYPVPTISVTRYRAAYDEHRTRKLLHDQAFEVFRTLDTFDDAERTISELAAHARRAALGHPIVDGAFSAPEHSDADLERNLHEWISTYVEYGHPDCLTEVAWSPREIALLIHALDTPGAGGDMKLIERMQSVLRGDAHSFYTIRFSDAELQSMLDAFAQRVPPLV